MLWHDPRLLFIHIPKTGGSSIEHVLHRCKLKQREGKVGQHATMQTAYSYMTEPDEYLKFTVIRNPWDRILSYYLMCYKRNRFSFPQIDIFKNREYVSFPEFYKNLDTSWLHVEDSFHYLAVNDEIPSDLNLLRFEHLEEDFLKLLNCHGIKIPMTFPHININNRASQNLRDYLKADPEYIETISHLYKKEIDYFNFEYKLLDR